MLPNEAWLSIAKGLAKETVELKTSANVLNEISKTYFARFEYDRLVFTGMPGMLGYEPIYEPVEVDYTEFSEIFPMYFSKLRFASQNKDAIKNCKYVFPLIKKYVVDKANGNIQDAAKLP